MIVPLEFDGVVATNALGAPGANAEDAVTPRSTHVTDGRNFMLTDGRVRNRRKEYDELADASVVSIMVAGTRADDDVRTNRYYYP
jgi:hypothetical protein